MVSLTDIAVPSRRSARQTAVRERLSGLGIDFCILYHRLVAIVERSADRSDALCVGKYHGFDVIISAAVPEAERDPKIEESCS